jgi:tyrosyl-tRNA synthetase
MSKTFGNYIGIQEAPKDIFGKVMSIPDTLIIRYATLLTNLNISELEKLPPRDAKLKLAEEIVAELYGREEAVKQREEFIRVFSKREVPEEIEEYKIEPEKLKDGKIWIVNLLTSVGFASSNSEARRLIRQGAVSIDGEKVTDENLELEVKEEFILRVGRYRFKKIVP